MDTKKRFPLFFLYIERFRHYLLSGPIGLSQYLSNYGKVFDVGDLFAVPVNIYNVVFGRGPMKTDIFNSLWVPISFTDYSNVGTLFDTVYLAVGYGGTLLFSFFLGFISYALQAIAFSRRKVRWLLMYIWLLTVLSFSFFAYYFYLLLVWEVAAYCLIVPFIVSGIYQFMYLKGATTKTAGDLTPSSLR